MAIVLLMSDPAQAGDCPSGKTASKSGRQTSATRQYRQPGDTIGNILRSRYSLLADQSSAAQPGLNH
ncbi:hypothetical protein [Leptolyngbya sp. FACHB-711]|uniref:hypothetical protein n=1 Tax=unclassified Leptolyngbya TaxID=2650499 RepID=UPI0016829DED|nr:hypothetical protein [Leptolyngbya sp. FACHB-711]MBD1850949.1 hypothetical protein [Cyanobacteria bacterium FACHB-502]MBD2024251.1 hypothetical protein [Leptolyngbya sp. FACHB-711]